MIKIAVPNKGRMFQSTISLLNNSGFKLQDFEERKLYVETNYDGVNLLFIRTQDIGPYVQSNVADVGITGYDLVIENRLSVEKILDLNYGFCRLVLAGPAGKKLKDGVRIATKYQNITSDYLKNLRVNGKIVTSSGALEIQPRLGLADFIVDLTSTGSTLKMNDLVVYDELLQSNAVLIANRKSIKKKSEEITEIKLAIESVILAENKSYMMFNISKDNLPQIIDKMPCMRAPTIVQTGDDRIVAVQTVVPKNDISKTINWLKRFGALDILVLDVKRVIL